MSQAAEDAYRAAIEATLAGIWVIDGQRRTSFVSPRMAAMLGYTCEDMLGMPVCAFVDAGTSDTFLDPPGKSEVRLLRKDSSTVWVSVSSGALPESLGSPGAVTALISDVTQRRTHSRSNEHLAAIVDSSDDAITDTAPGGIITSWNRGAERLYGYTAAEAVGQSIEMIIPPELRDELIDIVARLARGEQVEPRETARTARDGRRID